MLWLQHNTTPPKSGFRLHCRAAKRLLTPVYFIPSPPQNYILHWSSSSASFFNHGVEGKDTLFGFSSFSSNATVLFDICSLRVVVMSVFLIADCPLDLGASNFTLAASLCSSKDDRAKCCRYINAVVAVSIARYANATSSLGVSSDLSEICLQSVSETLELYGVPANATVFCGFGTKIPVNYDCMGRSTVMQMLDSPKFVEVQDNCVLPLSADSDCRKCLNAGIVYLHHLIGSEDNLTLSTCRDATFVALASPLDNVSTVDLATCFFGVQGLQMLTDSQPSSSPATPEAPPTPLTASNPSQEVVTPGLKANHHFHLTLASVVGIAVTAVSILLLLVLVLLIRGKQKQLEDSDNTDQGSLKAFSIPRSTRKFQEGSSIMFRKFSYKETKKATNDFSTIIGQGGFGTVFKAQFSDGLIAAVKQMNKVSEQAEDEFCREIELLARLHHRNLVALKGFCARRQERFLVYEFMKNGSLKDHLHSPGGSPLSWQARIQIAIDVANALEYLHFYCDPALCHRDIKSSNILLDENFTAKLYYLYQSLYTEVWKKTTVESSTKGHEKGKDFGLAHASKSGSISFEPVNTDVRGTPGYMDPEYVVTQELTEKSDVYSYGVLFLELVTGRQAIQDGKNLVEWSQTYLSSDSKIAGLVDLNLGNSFDFDQLQTVVTVIRWCTEREGSARPSIKQVLRLLYESCDPMHSGFIRAVEDEYDEIEGRGRTSKGKTYRGEVIFNNGDARCLASSSSTSRSYCSRSFLLETGSPQSPTGVLSL
ncbi:Protein kinase domain [Dillenia turbinata]|uniref:Protein kinase domain n=1 Tax=Dillenia turbinata TaxID=194707 RepID=A0AAN8W4U8_9MAGN